MLRQSKQGTQWIILKIVGFLEFSGLRQKLHFEFLKLSFQLQKSFFFLICTDCLPMSLTALDASSSSSTLLLLPFIKLEFRGSRQKLHIDFFENKLSTPKEIFFFQSALTACPCHCLGCKFFVIHTPTNAIH